MVVHLLGLFFRCGHTTVAEAAVGGLGCIACARGGNEAVGI